MMASYGGIANAWNFVFYSKCRRIPTNEQRDVEASLNRIYSNCEQIVNCRRLRELLRRGGEERLRYVDSFTYRPANEPNINTCKQILLRLYIERILVSTCMHIRLVKKMKMQTFQRHTVFLYILLRKLTVQNITKFWLHLDVAQCYRSFNRPTLH